MNNVADSLERLSTLQRQLGASDAAWSNVQEAVELRRAAAERSHALPDVAMLGYSLVRASEVAGAQGAIVEGYGYATEALDLLRQVCSSDASPRAAWRLLYGLKVALAYELHGMRLAAARELLAEVDAIKARLDPEVLAAITPHLQDIEAQRARALEESGDVAGAALVRAAARVDGGGEVN